MSALDAVTPPPVSPGPAKVHASASTAWPRWCVTAPGRDTEWFSVESDAHTVAFALNGGIAALESLLAEKQRQVDRLTDACQAISESVPCHSDHCRHYGLAHGKPCDVEAIRMVRAALGKRRAE